MDEPPPRPLPTTEVRQGEDPGDATRDGRRKIADIGAEPACAESCDDGDGVGLDGCSASCLVETGWTCTGLPSACTAACGDGLVRGQEACDDGALVPGDGCGPGCAIEPGHACAGEPSACFAGCGDGLRIGIEDCDDGNPAPGDGCSAACAAEPGWSCAGSPSACTPACLPGLVSAWTFDGSNAADSVGPYHGTLTAGASIVDSWLGKGVSTTWGCSGGNRSGASVGGFPEFAADSFTVELSHQPSCAPVSYQLYALFSKGFANTGGVGVINQTTTPYGGGDLYRFRFGIGGATGRSAEVVGRTVTFSCATAHHVVAIRDRAGAAIRLYVDGVLEGEVPDTVGDLKAGTTIYLGGVNFDGGCGWGQSAGTMDAGAFYLRALSRAEVAALHARWQARKQVCGN